MTTKEQLFADLEKDRITADANTISKAKDEDGEAMSSIGDEYYDKQKYDKAMAWYRLAADKNNLDAQNSIGFLYRLGLGVPQDYLLAIEWFLKSAIQNNKDAWRHIGWLFKEGQGVPVNKYKALEWYTKSGQYPNVIRELTNQGIQLTQQDKNKSVEQLIMETEDIVWPGKTFATQKRLKEEINTLKQLMNKMEKESIAINNEIKSLKEENQKLRLRSERQQQQLDVKQESIEQHKRKEQTTNNEVQSLKQANHTLGLKMEFLSEKEKQKIKNLEKENRAMKRELKSFRASNQENALQGGNLTKNDSNANASKNNTDYDMEHHNYESDNNDINYDTPDEEGDNDNNNLNYDNDEQVKNTNK